MLSTILIVVLILIVIGALPTWPYSANWGYYPSSGLGLVSVRGLSLTPLPPTIITACLTSGVMLSLIVNVLNKFINPFSKF